MGVIKHLAIFLRKLPELCRVSYLPILHDILHSTNPFNWRLRQHLAIQLPALVRLPPTCDAFRTMFPTVMTLLQDPVASVRRETFKGVSSLIMCVYEVSTNAESKYAPDQVEIHQHHFDELIKAVNSFVASPKCQMRQLWLELCLQLLKDLPAAVFEAHFLQGILSLICDRVTNVRLALAALLVGWSPEYLAPWETSSDASPWNWLLKRADIKNCVERLSKDDGDIHSTISILTYYYNDITFEKVSCRGKHSAPGGDIPVELNDNPVIITPNNTFVPEPLRLAESNIDRIQQRNGTENSFRSRSSSIDYTCEETRLRRLSSCNDSDMDEMEATEPFAMQMQVAEKDYISSIDDPEVVEELDIIDGLYHKPLHNEGFENDTKLI